MHTPRPALQLSTLALWGLLPALSGVASTAWATSTTTLVAPPPEVAVGTALTLTANLSFSPKAVVSCKVTFRDGTTELGSVFAPTGAAATVSLTLPAFTATGNHSYTAVFNAAKSLLCPSTSTSEAAAVAVKYASSTTLQSNVTSARAGQAITLTASVNTGISEGTVTFEDAGKAVGTASVVKGVATLVYSTPALGTHKFSASYSGGASTMKSTTTGTVDVTLNGRDFFVASDGSASDTNPGTETQPWATLAKLAAQKLAADQSYRLKCGSEWRESLTLTAANLDPTNTQKLVSLSGYGPCSTSRPVINAALRLPSTGWVQVSGETRPIYQYTFPAGSAPAAITQLVVQGGTQPDLLQEARYPNSGYLSVATTSPDALTDDKDPSQTQYADHLTTTPADHAYFSQLPAGSLVGAIVHVHTAVYRVEDMTVGSYQPTTEAGAGGQINFSQPGQPATPAYTGLPPTTGYGYVLTGKRWMLDQAGEWVYDPTSRTLTLWARTGVNPNTLQIDASVRTGLAVSGVSAQVQNLAVRYAAGDGIAVDGAAGSILSNVDVAYSNGHGVTVSSKAASSAGFQINGSRVANSRLNGINVSYVDSASLTGNVVSDTGLANELRHSDCGICVEGGGAATLTGNQVLRSAYLGIRYPNRKLGAAQSLIQGNTVDGACLRFDDCGGIYTYTGTGAYYDLTRSTAPEDLFGSTVRDNFVRHVPGSTEGTPNRNVTNAVGIYLDNNSYGIDARNNLIDDTQMGIVLNHASHIQVSGNSLTNVRYACFLMGNDVESDQAGNTHPFPAANVAFTNNSCVASGTYGLATNLVPAGETQHLAVIASVGNGAALGPLDFSPSGITFSGNRYTGLYGPAVFHLSDPAGRGEIEVDRNGWLQLFPGDDAQADPLRPVLKTFLAVEKTPAIFSSDFSATQQLTYRFNGQDVTRNCVVGWDCTSSIEQRPAALCGGSATSACGSRVTDPADPSGLSTFPFTVSRPFDLTAGSTYLVKMRVRTPAGSRRFEATVGRHCTFTDNSGGSYRANVGYWGSLWSTNSEWQTYVAPFKAGFGTTTKPCTDPNLARFDFWVDPVGPLLFDDVAVVPADVTIGMSSDDFRVLSNPSDASSSVACPDSAASGRCAQYVTLGGASVTWPVTLAPRSSMVVLWSASPFYNGLR